MSDDVQRYMMYYDDLVPDDKGTWIRLEDYEALRSELTSAVAKQQIDEKQCDDMTETAGQLAVELAAKDKRIEELELALAKASLRTQELKKELSLVEEELFYPDKHGYAIITFDQIDAAWERLMYYKNSKEFKDQLIWQCIGTILEPFNIVACEECGGSGVVREHERGYEDGVEDTCPSCNGHGWVIK